MDKLSDETPARERLYTDLAAIVRLLSPPAEYAEEAAFWRCVLRARLGEGRHHLLELGVGGGHNLSHLTAEFDATAVDLSAAMLEQCRGLNPGVELFVGDMRNVRLGRTFDAVLIHDAVSYMTTEADLRAAFETAGAHLRPGGVFITSPDFTTETFQSPSVHTATHGDGTVDVTYFEFAWDPDPADTTVEVLMTYVIREGRRARLEHDRHVIGLFPNATWLRLCGEAGFEVDEQTFALGPEAKAYRLLVGTRR
ncbi:MAG: class I SAM-dependent methyltransferase [Vicinamibacterales bacterium]|nr:class I SAM-dependent methyltransferase [Vicinamibacterales bacterium]